MNFETPLKSLHEKAGARLGEYFGCLLPESFGQGEQEHQMAREAVALFDTCYRAYVYLTGPDRVRFLNAIATNDVKSLGDGQGSQGLLLNPQGHILAEIECCALGDSILVLSHALVREQTVQWLEKYIIMDDVTVEDATGRIGSVALEGPGTASLLHSVCGLKLEAMPELAHREVVIGAATGRAIRRSHFGEIGVEIVATREALPAVWQTLAEAARQAGGVPIGYAVLNALRLQAGVPWFSYDFDDQRIPHEAGLETSHISYTKGCYTGQEIVERVRSRGHVNRKRIGLQFDGSAPPRAETKLLYNGKEVGHVTSAAYSPARRRAIGIGYLRHEHTAPGSRVQYEAGTAEVIELPLPEITALRATRP